MDTLKTVQGVVQEKGKLVAAVPPNGLVVLGEDHEYVSHLEQMARARVVKAQGKGVDVSRNVVAVCHELKIPRQVVENALERFQAPEHRLRRMEFPGLTVIDDTYNANPLSMRLGLDTVAATSKPGQRRVAILGYMAELGDEAASYHRELCSLRARARRSSNRRGGSCTALLTGSLVPRERRVRGRDRKPRIRERLLSRQRFILVADGARSCPAVANRAVAGA